MNDKQIQLMILEEYHRIRRNNPEYLDGNKIWQLAKKYVHAQMLADWLMMQQNLGIGAFK